MLSVIAAQNRNSPAQVVIIIIIIIIKKHIKKTHLKSARRRIAGAVRPRNEL